jgi:hypothetical protein
MGEQVLGVFAMVVLIGFVGFVICIQICRAQTLLKGWAEKSGSDLDSSVQHYCLIAQKPSLSEESK